MSIDMRDIQYFLEVAKRGLLSRAAEECGVTQPALTKAVQRMEAVFGLQLFERTARGMVLSSAGLRVAEQMQRLYANYADTMHLANEMRAQKAGLLRIGVTDATGKNPIGPALITLLSHRPGLQIRMQVGRSDALAAQVHDGDLDAALVPAYEGQPFEVEMTKIDEDLMVPIARAGHPLAHKPALELSEVVPYGWVLSAPGTAVYRAVADNFAREKLPAPRVVLEVTQVSELVLTVLASTDLIVPMPSSYVRRAAENSLAVLPVAQLRVARSVVLLTRSGSSWSPLIGALKDALLQNRHRLAEPGLLF